MFKFAILQKSKKSKARLGKITTPHGEIITPAFIPVATLGVIKGGLDYLDVEKCKAQCEIVNTFHFWDLDAVDTVKKAGGLHKFPHWDKPLFTDSGGFQVFSLGKGAEFGIGKIQSIFPNENKISLHSQVCKDVVGDDKSRTILRRGLVKKISEEGVRFLSPRDGRELMLTPEKSAEIQITLGADFIYVLDICGSVIDDKKTTEKDLERTNRWFRRFLQYYNSPRKSAFSQRQSATSQVFGIIQGGLYKDLRIKSTEFVNELPVFGTAIGGAFIKKDLLKILSWISTKTDYSRPHHMLGIGDLESLPDIIKLGIDLFDCALPTRIARHGTAITKSGYLDIKKTVFKNKFQPVDKKCRCFTCENYSIAQLNFLARAKEPLAGRLLTIHNLYFLENYLENIRAKIEGGKI